MNTEWKELNSIVEVAEAVAAGMEIEVYDFGCWNIWNGASWSHISKYRARPRKLITPVQIASRFGRWNGDSVTMNYDGIMAFAEKIAADERERISK